MVMIIIIINNNDNNIKIIFFVPIEYYCDDSNKTTCRPIGTRLTGERAEPNGGERTHGVCVSVYVRACARVWIGMERGPASRRTRVRVFVRATSKENGNGDGRRRRRVTMPPARW